MLRLYNFSFDFDRKRAEKDLRAKLMAIDISFETDIPEDAIEEWIWYDCVAAFPFEVLCAVFGLRYWNVMRIAKLIRTMNFDTYLAGTLILRKRLGKSAH